jgi:hypothetical protein
MALKIGITDKTIMDHLDSTYRVYAEVWSQDENGIETPVCWISSLVNIDEGDISS